MANNLSTPFSSLKIWNVGGPFGKEECCCSRVFVAEAMEQRRPDSVAGQLGQFKFHIFILTFFVLWILSTISFAQQNLGIPIREAICWGVFVGPGKTGKMDTIYLSFGQYDAPLFLLSVDPNTGQIRQFNGPLSSEVGAWGFAIDDEKRIYLGSYYSGHLLRFDPQTEKWEDLGQPAGESESFICKLTLGRDGKIWGGTFPSAKLFSYDPKTGVVQDYGRMDPDQFYCYPTAGDDGLIYCAIQFERTDIVLFDPEKQSKTSLIPLEDRKPGRVSFVKGRDRNIYANLSASQQWFQIKGDKMIEIPRSDIPYPQTSLLEGQTFRLINENSLQIENLLTKEKREISLWYEAAASYIFVVGTGPDGRIYGSSMLPLRLFVYDPNSQSLINLGKGSLASGEVYSLSASGDKLYFCSYPEARLSVYDPKKPLKFGDQEDSNPRDLGPLGGGQYRPRAMVIGHQGRIYIGSYPDYGLLGGAISVYDPEKNQKRVYRHVVQNQSIASLAYIKTLDLIAAGSSVRGGTGTHAVEKEAKFILWDPKEEKKILEIVPVPEARTILSLVATEDGIVYGIAENQRVFVFDSQKREIKKVFALEFRDPLEISLQIGPDGRIYGLAKEAIFVINPKDDQVSLLAKSSVPISSGMAVVGWKIYFGSGANLYEFEIPKEPTKE